MLTVKRLPSALLVLAGCLFFVPASWAQAPHGHPGGFHRGFEISTGFTFFNFSENAALDNDFGWGFRFGYMYNPQQEIEFLINWVSTTGTVLNATPPPAAFGTNDDITNFQTAYVFNFTTHDVVPYLTAGIGFVDTHDSALGSETDFSWGAGGGFRFFMGRTVFARIEGRYNGFQGSLPVYSNGENFHFTEVSFGIGWRFPV
jgi:opacity protein-like surface antigen